jgi:hypothetical protein
MSAIPLPMAWILIKDSLKNIGLRVFNLYTLFTEAEVHKQKEEV